MILALSLLALFVAVLVVVAVLRSAGKDWNADGY